MNTDKEKGAGHPILNTIKEGLAFIREAGDLVIKSEQKTFEEFLKQKSPELDRYIISLETAGDCRYISGEITLLVDDDEKFFHLEANFYFKDSDGTWIKKEIKGKSTEMSWHFFPDQQDQLRFKRKISFEYDRP